MIKILQRNNFKLTRIECETAPNLCHKFDCYLAPINRTRTLLTVLCELQEPIEDMIVSVVMETRNSKNIYSTWVNETVNYCEKIGKDHSDFFGLVEGLMNKLDDIVQSCPIKARMQLDEQINKYF